MKAEERASLYIRYISHGLCIVLLQLGVGREKEGSRHIGYELGMPFSSVFIQGGKVLCFDSIYCIYCWVSVCMASHGKNWERK